MFDLILFKIDKIYEARHKLLDLTSKEVVEAEIPSTYFSLVEQEFNTSALVEILSSVPNSPLTPGGLLQNFTPTFPNPSFQNQLCNRVQDFSNLTPANLRYHALQQQALQQQGNNHTLSSGLVANGMPSYSTCLNVSPRSTSTNTSGYLSHASNILNISGSTNSLEQLYAPYKPIQLNGNNMNHYPQSEFVGGSATNLQRNLNESGNHSFESESRLLTPGFHSVCIIIYNVFREALFIFLYNIYSHEHWTLIGNVLKV